ncbi:MAG: protease, partial [bacterium]|nr:protease [bacterium]
MKKYFQIILLPIFLITLFPNYLTAAIEGRFMQFPDIRGDKIVFTYEGDLWTISQTCGLAIRLTTHPGNEYAAKFSPDGKSIAFTGNYHSGDNVYLMPIDGGEPTRLTYQAASRVVTWTPDGKKIIFRSGFENTFRPMPRGVLCTFSPDGKKMIYNPRGNEEYYWKRYKGGQYQDIWLFDFDSKNFQKLTDYVGKNSYPMWIGDKMYYVSDQGKNGIANIYRYDFATKKIEQVTQYDDFDVQMPSTDGKQIIYLQSGYLYVLDP